MELNLKAGGINFVKKYGIRFIDSHEVNSYKELKFLDKGLETPMIEIKLKDLKKLNKNK
jgi:hypothetical protein